ncbi:MAG: flippase activity-associated protein Agl23 [Anaerolineales bacterium]|jgi:predicted membrane-bound mannosyltransferase/sugar lactone lactonase YvrE
MDQQFPTSSWLDRAVIRGFPIRWEHLLWTVLCVVAIGSRFAMLDTRVMSHDESQHTQLAWYLYQGRGYTPNPMTHGPFQIMLLTGSFAMFGADDFSARVPAALFGVAAVMILYFFRRWLGRAGALAAGALMAISPYMLYYSRYVRNESFVVVWGLLMFYAIGRYLESRQPRWLYLLAAATALHYATKETAYIYVVLAIVFLAGLLQLQLILQHWENSGRRGRYLFFSFLAVVLAAGAAALFVAGRGDLIQQAKASGVVTPPDMMTHTAMLITSPIVQIGLALLILGLLALGAAIWTLLSEFPLPVLRESLPVVDILVVMGTTLLPQLAAFPMALFNLNPFDGDPFVKIRDTMYIIESLACLLAVIIPAIVIGLLWNRKLWLICAGIFFGIYFALFSVALTNFAGVVVGLVGSVNYWMAQQEVHRGTQPWYYYILLQIPVYEYLPAFLLISSPFVAWGLRKKQVALENKEPSPQTGEAEPESRDGTIWHSIVASPVPWMFAYWCVGALIAFTLAGEKMPWLTVHITLPMILLGGWVIGKVIEKIDWAWLLVSPRWIGLLVLPSAVIASVQTLVTLAWPVRPFSGNTLDQLAATGNFVSYFVVAAVSIFLLVWLWRGILPGRFVHIAYLGIVIVLALLTARTAWMASYINYNDATEFLVYAHSASGVKTALSQIEEISHETHDDLNIVVPYDVRSGWLMNWYLRDYPNAVNYGETLDRSYVDDPVVIVADMYWPQADKLLSKTHYAFTYMRLWWPMMDYFNLTWNRIQYALARPEYWTALWDIWWNRDYSAYATLTGENLTLSGWPSGERMRLYVRKDIAAQLWQYGSEAFSPPVAVDPYAGAVRNVAASEIWSQAGTDPGSLQRPRGIAAAPDGSIYVVDTNNHRIQHFDPVGNLINFWGGFSGTDSSQAATGLFNEPWGVAVGPDGSVYVADTWNFRIQKFDAKGNFLKTWGSSSSADPNYALYGPRAVAVDSQGRVFVADTGNKRIVIYDAEGKFLDKIGEAGFDSGQFDEPVGVAIGPDGRLYVADTWNQRVQVFQETNGTWQYQKEWPIAGWEGQSTDMKPYLAVSSDGRVWVTDPGNARVLVFDAEGKFLFTFGAFGKDSSSFAMPSGIAVDSKGNLFITDTDNNRIMVFAGL